MKRRICFFTVLAMLAAFCTSVRGETIEGVDAKASVLMEHSTGTILCEDNADERLPVASVTKIMTMLLIMEQIEKGALSYDDMVNVSENAMSYGGSTMFLEAGEQLSVNDMLKGIAVASANDGCVAMAEHIAGGEGAFVEMMNKRAQELGMENTHFMNTNGLDEENHYSSARDVAIMSAELLKYKDITNYTSIWIDELRDGKFQLANTNRLIRFYSGANGLKTGSTNAALCCLSASAVRDGMQLIAVVLGSPTSDKRFGSAKALLDHGFANYKVKTMVNAGEELGRAGVKNGLSDYVSAVAAESRSYLESRTDTDEKELNICINEWVNAPVERGEEIGYAEITDKGEIIDRIKLCAAEGVEKKGYLKTAGELASFLMGISG